MRTLCSRPALLAGVSFAILAFPATAADLTVTETRNTPVVTSNANGGPGNVTIDGTLDVPGGTALTVDSSHNVTINQSRVVRSTTQSNGRGVVVDAPAGGLTSTITNNGQIVVTGTNADGTAGSNNIGLLIGGAGAMNGNVVSGANSSINVGGNDSFGVSVAGQLNGSLGLRSVVVSGARSTAVSVTGGISDDVTLAGSLAATGSGGIGLAVRGDVGGTMTSGAAITTGVGETTASDGTVTPAVSGEASVLVSGSVAGGFVNDRYYIDENGARVAPADVDTSKHVLVAGSISAIGGAPAFLVSPGASATRDASLGNVGTGDEAYGIVNRGSMTAAGSTAGRAVDAVRIVGGNGFSALTGGGLHNLGTGSIGAGAVNADAAAVRVGDSGVVPEIRNAGRIEARADRTGGDTPGAGGNAYAIRIDAGGNVDTITNSGTIVATANGDNRAAFGILDAGGLETLTNSGTIRAVSNAGSNVARIAVDTSANANGLTLNNSGKIEGDLRFGGGNDVLNVTAGSITGNVAFGAGANQLAISGGTLRGTLTAAGGTIAAALSGTGILDLTGQDGVTFASLNAADGSRIVLDVGTGFTGITVTGAASFTGTSAIDLYVRDLLSTSQTVTLLTASGGLTTDHAGTIVSSANTPFIYAVDDIDIDATSLRLTLRRKTADELGLNAAYGAIYESAITALAGEQALTSAVNTLRDAASLHAAVKELAPTTYGSGGARVLVANQDAAFGVLGHRMATVRHSLEGSGSSIAGVDRPNFGVWVQQTGSFFKRLDEDDDPGYDGNSYGLAVGGDLVVANNAAIGLGLSYVASEVKPDRLRESPLVIGNLQADLYGTARFGDFFVDATAGYAVNDYKSRREITFGGLGRTAEADFSGSQIAANLTVGYELRLGRLRVVPSTTLNALKVKQDGYTESEAGDLNLEVESMSFDLMRNTTRLGLGYAIPFGDGEFRLDAHGAIVSRIGGDDVLATRGRFVAGGAAFYLETESAAASGWRAGAAASYVGGRAAFGVSYDHEDSKGYQNNALTMSLGLHF